MALPKYDGKKKLQLVCGNAIAEIGGKKKIFLAIVVNPIAENGKEKRKKSGFRNLRRN